MKILITGGLGFLGSHLLKKLSNAHEIYVIDNLLKQVHGNEYNIINNIDFTCGDVSDKKTWKRFYGKSFDVLIHLAAETGTGQSAYLAEQCCKTNILSTAIINDIIVNKNINFEKIILASSRAVYGEGSESVGISESATPKPVSIYGISKLTQEQILLKSKNVTVLRLQNVYGDGQSLTNPYTGIVSLFTALALNGHEITLFENGEPIRDFINVYDVVNAFILAINSKEFGVFNIGSGNKTTILDLAKIISNNTGANIKTTNLKRSGDVKHIYADISLAKQKLKFEPEISLNIGIGNFILWAKNKKISMDNIIKNYKISLKELASKGLLNEKHI